MTIEKKLIEKTYYEDYTKDRTESPIEILGLLYIAEQRKNIPDLTSIRFAQGELYFQYHDYEAAIFKWENITNELEPWSKKNLADAYMELEEYSTAESFYKSIETDSELLQVEISLQLFALYIQKGNHEMALDTIKGLLLTHPDYANMTELARSYFEEQAFWEEAIELAKGEASRTKSFKWFETLIHYSKLGVIAAYEPSSYKESLLLAQELDNDIFERWSASLWDAYKDTSFYLTWIHEFQTIFQPKEKEQHWSILSLTMEQSFLELMDGRFPLKEIERIAPAFLVNFFYSANEDTIHTAASAVLAWNDLFPHTLELPMVKKAEEYIHSLDGIPQPLEVFLQLFQAILQWANKHDIPLDKKFSHYANVYLSSENHHLLVIGEKGSGVNSFINNIVGEPILTEETKGVFSIKDQDYLEIKEITNDGEIAIQSLADLDNLLVAEDDTKAFELTMPSSILGDNKWTITSAPFTKDNAYSDYALLSDSLLFIINEHTILQYSDYEQLVHWREESPSNTLQFLIYSDDLNEEVASDQLEKAKASIRHYFPSSTIFVYNKEEKEKQLHEMTAYYQEHFRQRNIRAERTAKSVSIIQDIITNLLDKRVDMTNSLQHSLKRNEEMVSKLSGAKNQLSDMESMKAKHIATTFDALKLQAKEQIQKDVPELLRQCKELVKEDSDFGKVHLQINEEMNQRLQHYVQDVLKPNLYDQIQDWISGSRKELEDSQHFLQELCEVYNDMYEEESLSLEGDFTIIDDWRRDARRLTSGWNVEKMNILLRFNPSQVLLKSAGKLLGGIVQNKKMLQVKYQKYIESEEYKEVADSIIAQLLQQFDFYEKGLENDIRLFFSQPKEELQQSIEKKQQEMVEYEELLDTLKHKPEIFLDPLRLFEWRLLRYDWLTNTSKEISTHSF